LSRTGCRIRDSTRYLTPTLTPMQAQTADLHPSPDPSATAAATTSCASEPSWALHGPARSLRSRRLTAASDAGRARRETAAAA